MNIFDRIFCFVIYTCFAFVLIRFMEDWGKLIGFEQMEDLGISFVFGSVYMHLMIMDDKKKDNEEKIKKDGVN